MPKPETIKSDKVIDEDSPTPMADRLDIIAEILQKQFNLTETEIGQFKSGYYTGFLQVVQLFKEAADSDDDAYLERILAEAEELVDADILGSASDKAFTVPPSDAIN